MIKLLRRIEVLLMLLNVLTKEELQKLSHLVIVKPAVKGEFSREYLWRGNWAQKKLKQSNTPTPVIQPAQKIR